jgi:predicted MPP superfamily phosphohydrolase
MRARSLSAGGKRLHLGGIDDAHFYEMADIEKVAATIPHDEFSILISHTPEVYRQAALAGFNLLLSGHTHGVRFAFPAASQSRLIRFCPVPWAPALGSMGT